MRLAVRTATVFAIVLLVLADDASSQATAAEEITVTANRTEVPLAATGSSVTLIQREEIERRHQATVLELLRTVPGLEVVQTGGPGRITSVFIRGGDSAHTLVLVDGVRVNSTSSGGFDFANLKTDDVERIEVVRGPQSTLYGSEAMAGVVSITTRRGRGEPEGWAEVEGGTDDFRQLRAGVTGALDRSDFSLALGHLHTGGLSTASERRGNTEEDPSTSLSASARVGLGFGEDSRIDLTAVYVDADTDLDGFDFAVGPVDDPNAEQTSRTLTSRLQLETSPASWWRQTLAAAVADERLEGEDPDTLFNNFAIDGRSTQLTSQSDLTLAGNNLLTVGLQYEDRETDNHGTFDGSTTLWSGFVQDQWSWRDRLFLTGSLRHDDHSQFGGETTYRVTALHQLGGGPRLRASFGTGFRAPSLNELHFPGFGNPELKPETSRGFDVGIEQDLPGQGLTLGATYFSTAYRDLIAFDLATFLANNVAEADVEGVEVSLSYAPLAALKLNLSHLYTDSENLDTGRPLARRPRNRSTAAVFFDAGGRLDGTLTVISVRDRIDSDGATMDDYLRVDLTLDYPWGERFKVFARAGNLLDEDYEEVPGFTSPGLQVSLGLRARL